MELEFLNCKVLVWLELGGIVRSRVIGDVVRTIGTPAAETLVLINPTNKTSDMKQPAI